MKKIGFVTPWFGENIPGGAEAELRGLATHLSSANVPVEILTTCVKEFASDWGYNYYTEGEYRECGLTVRRFKADKRNRELFDGVNHKLMQGIKINSDEEQIYARHMINSKRLYRYMDNNKSEYSLFVFIPYMFGTTYNGCSVCPEKSIIIPCLHDESYAYMNIFRDRFSKVAGMIFLSKPEADLTKKLYQLDNVYSAVLGGGGFSEITFNKDIFLERYNIKEPYILYMGRKDVGKNVDILLRYFAMYKKRMKNKLKLILLGGGEIEVPSFVRDDVYDLGFVTYEDKYNAAAGALFLCQPSQNESFSLVIMESWLCKRPILVNEQCAVTKHFARESKGGLYFKDYFEFESCINYFLYHPDIADEMGENGREYVLHNFMWDVIVQKYTDYFKKVCDNES